MTQIFLGLAGFALFLLADFAALKRIPVVKPIAWIIGTGVLIYSICKIIGTAPRFTFNPLLASAGWVLIILSGAVLVYALFINIPLRKTYIQTGIGKELVTSGLYSVVRHPGWYPFAGVMTGLVLVFPSTAMVWAATVWALADLALIIFQDRIIFPRMFKGYQNYQKEIPMIVPGFRLPKSISESQMGARESLSNTESTRSAKLSVNVELFKKGNHAELWERCCGFIDLSIDQFSYIQKRLLLEQLELLKKCELGQNILNGARPQTVEEFRQNVPLTTYNDYHSYLPQKREDGLPAKPILWQCTSGKSGESAFRWVPVTARQLEEIEPLIFALIFFSSCRNRGEVRFAEGDNVFYGLAPPPYASGTMTKVLPHEIFTFIPPVETSEQITFEERIKLGFRMAINEGLDLCFAMSSVAVAIGKRFSGSGSSASVNVKNMIKKPCGAIRILKGLLISRIQGRELLPQDLFKLKGMVTFGLDGVIFREKIKEMWGRYPLDFHGCTEAVVIAMQTWDYEGMTFIPHLNFFEFITEEDSRKSYQEQNFVPPTYLIDEIVPGNYELVITSFHGGPLVRYRLGHLVKIHSLRNEKLDIDIPQMSFIGRVDDQIDIAGFTRLSEKIIWQAIEKTGIPYAGWTARKEVSEKPVLNIYIETTGEQKLAMETIADKVHEELKKLDEPYSELESFTGLKPLRITLLPRGAFAAYKQYQLKNEESISQLEPPHLNASDDIIKFLMHAGEASQPSANVISAK